MKDNKMQEDVWHSIVTKDFEGAKKKIDTYNLDVNFSLIDGLSYLHCAARMGANELLEFLIDKGANIEVRDDFGNTPLIRAISSYNFQDDSTIKLLLSKGADVEAKNDSGVSVRDFCKKKGYIL